MRLMELYPGRSSFLYEKPFQKYRLRITTVAAELGNAIITPGNIFKRNTMSISHPGGELHVSIIFLHLSEYFLISLNGTNSILVTMKCPYGNIFNYRGINKFFIPGQPTPGWGSCSCKIFRIRLNDPVSPFTSHGVPQYIYPIDVNGWQFLDNVFDVLKVCFIPHFRCLGREYIAGVICASLLIC